MTPDNLPHDLKWLGRSVMPDDKSLNDMDAKAVGHNVYWMIRLAVVHCAELMLPSPSNDYLKVCEYLVELDKRYRRTQ